MNDHILVVEEYPGSAVVAFLLAREDLVLRELLFDFIHDGLGLLLVGSADQHKVIRNHRDLGDVDYGNLRALFVFHCGDSVCKQLICRHSV